MSTLEIVIAPNPIFKMVCEDITEINNNIRNLADDMVETMYHEHAVGLGANMVGLLKKIAVIDLVPNGIKEPYILFNPEIINYSKEMQEFEEASLSFPGISAIVKRPRAINVKYLDYDGNEQITEVTDFKATVFQHEIKYLYGETYLDLISPVKREMLLNKMKKFIKAGLHKHVHSSSCRH